MKNVLMLIMLLVICGSGIGTLFTVCGCDDSAAMTVSRGEGVLDDAHQRRRRIQCISDNYARQITDDADEIFFADANLHLNQYLVNYGW
ncbi:MAG TPA: hypothetical protein PKK48_06690 [Phycisphaerae bacterium]|nr:hypothetical protein [Phycisphaerae bacterium]HPS53477.1 hypothetical protein [Phycisphaerae bacterium]